MSRPFYVLALWLAAGMCYAQTLESNRISSKPYEINELRAKVQLPGETWKVFKQSWIPITANFSGAPYNGNAVFVYTGKPGVVGRVLYMIDYVEWTTQKSQSESRFYVLEFAGEPEPPKPEPPKPEPPKPEPPVEKAKRITYVYEREDQTVPRPIQAAIRRLNEAEVGIQASSIDKDAKDGTGAIPEQYAAALSAVSRFSVPFLAVEDGSGRIEIIENPTAQDILKYIP